MINFEALAFLSWKKHKFHRISVYFSWKIVIFHDKKKVSGRLIMEAAGKVWGNIEKSMIKSLCFVLLSWIPWKETTGVLFYKQISYKEKTHTLCKECVQNHYSVVIALFCWRVKVACANDFSIIIPSSYYINNLIKI